jgi:hypothetical protein
VYTSPLLHTCYMPRPSYYSRLDHPTSIVIQYVTMKPMFIPLTFFKVPETCNKQLAYRDLYMDSVMLQ